MSLRWQKPCGASVPAVSEGCPRHECGRKRLFWRGTPFACLSAWTRGDMMAFVSPQLVSEYFETFEELVVRYADRRPADWPDVLSHSAEMVFALDRARGATNFRDE
ncbi:MAG: putative toxin-antitoxin system toxin component, family [Verrucomicrobiales bacterium]|nr:putative toxin-antitoxin system toxin component, family [Verrucomicrobiales bacterium]